LITSDGSLSNNGRHITFTSTDLGLIKIFREGLDLNVKIGTKSSGFKSSKIQYRIQFGNKSLHEYLISIGITPRKSLILSNIKIPEEYFWDFLRGCIDGDGNISVTKHPESTHFQLRVRLASGSESFLKYIKKSILENSNVQGGSIRKDLDCFSLNFGKSDGLTILKKMYKNPGKWYLSRKKEIVDQILS
jgi:intein/homing endonuclease